MRLQNGETRRFSLHLNSLLWSRWRWRGAGDVKADTSLVMRMLHFARFQSNRPNNNTSLNCFSCYSQICVVTLFLIKQTIFCHCNMKWAITWPYYSADPSACGRFAECTCRDSQAPGKCREPELPWAGWGDLSTVQGKCCLTKQASAVAE